MNMLHTPVNWILWKWHQEGFFLRYTAAHVNETARRIRANFNHQGPWRIICVTDDPEGIDECETFPLWTDFSKLKNASGANLPSCYRRLKLFDMDTLKAMGIERGERVISIDLDALITGDLRPIVFRDGTFVGWAVPGTYHRRVFNGSMFMFYAGLHTDLWHNFDPQRSPREASQRGFLGSDQGWISWRMAHSAPGWQPHRDGVLSYTRDVRPRRMLPKGTKIVFFHGRQKPWDPAVQREAPWIKNYLDVNGWNKPRAPKVEAAPAVVENTSA